MKTLRHWIVAVCALLVCGVAGAKGKNDLQTVYIFGVGAAFGDTVVCFTDIQKLEGKELVKKGFLQARSQYSYQLKNYLEYNENLPHRTCAIYFSEKKGKIEKAYSKLKAKYEGDKTLFVRTIPSLEFKFEEVE